MFKVSEKVFCGPRPTTDEIHKLAQMGVATIVNLERGWFELIHGKVNEEFADCVSAGITPLHIAFGDVYAPTIKELGAAHVAIIYAQMNGSVYFHCLRGKDRTGMVRAIFRVDQGWTVDKAVAECLSLGGLAFPYSILGWEKRLREFLNAYQSKTN